MGLKMWKSRDFYERIRKTGEDLTTLEINTIIKPEMTATTPPSNNRLALYQLAGTYAAGLDKLGRKYEDFAAKGNRKELIPIEGNLFRVRKVFEGGGIFSFRELRLWARYAIAWIQKYSSDLQVPNEICEQDILILARIEVKSLEMSRILEDTLENEKKNGGQVINPMNDQDTGMATAQGELQSLSPSEKLNALTAVAALAAKINDINLLSPIPPEIQTLERLYYHLHPLLHVKEKGGDFLLYGDDIPLDLKHKLVIHKSLDLGTEHIMMQTRISLDGDITTRISNKFADKPQQFILDMHNTSISMAVGYWEKIFDALVSWVNRIPGRKK